MSHIFCFCKLSINLSGLSTAYRFFLPSTSTSYLWRTRKNNGRNPPRLMLPFPRVLSRAPSLWRQSHGISDTSFSYSPRAPPLPISYQPRFSNPFCWMELWDVIPVGTVSWCHHRTLHNLPHRHRHPRYQHPRSALCSLEKAIPLGPLTTPERNHNSRGKQFEFVSLYCKVLQI
jgi:hypothetical protein